jgi:hypothetical protein
MKKGNAMIRKKTVKELIGESLEELLQESTYLRLTKHGTTAVCHMPNF